MFLYIFFVCGFTKGLPGLWGAMAWKNLGALVIKHSYVLIETLFDSKLIISLTVLFLCFFFRSKRSSRG